MDITYAKELLSTLADGVNPLTGEVLPENDSCNQVEIVRALNTALRYLDESPVEKRKAQPENAGRPWTKEDDESLCAMFDAGIDKKDICAHFKRSSGAISSRLVRLGKIR